MTTIIGTPILNVNRNSYSFAHQNVGMSIGTRIKAARRSAKLTQKELADKVGIAQATLSELETGGSAGTTLIASFASALNVNALWLETGRGPASIASWPFDTSKERYDALPDDEKLRLNDYIEYSISAYEQRQVKKKSA